MIRTYLYHFLNLLVIVNKYYYRYFKYRFNTRNSTTEKIVKCLKVSVQFSSVTQLCPTLCPTPWTAVCQASLSITNSWSPPKPMSIELVMPSSHLILCCPLLLLPSIFPNIRVFSSASGLYIRWPKYWSFSFNISPSSEHPGLISFRMDWLDLLAVQGTLKSLQHHSSKASVLRCSAFFLVQLSHPYMTPGKTRALTRQNFVGKIMSLLFNSLSRLVITFLPRSKRLLISWMQSPTAVIFEPRKIKLATVSTGVVAARAHRCGWEELPHTWGKEQRLHFAGVAVKRYPTSKVRETQLRL